jgi:hypothetical protein
MKSALLLLALPLLLLAQVYQSECPCYKSPYQQDAIDDNLKTLLGNGVIPKLRKHDVNNCTYRAWSTVMLKPEGTQPPALSTEKDPQRESLAKRDAWSCQHSAFSLIDDNPATGWAAPNDGEGAIVVALADLHGSVEIWAGNGKSGRLFKANARPREITVYVLQAAPQTSIAQETVEFTDVQVIAHQDYDLKDQNGFQPLPYPKFTRRSEPGQTFLAIEIRSVYPGKKTHDVYISEIRNAQ